MKKIIFKSPLFLLSLILAFLAIGQPIMAKSLLMGTIQFPYKIKKAPDIRIYYGGKIIQTDIHEGIPKVTFEINKGPRQNRFYFVIAQDFTYEVIKTPDEKLNHNTLAHWKIPEDVSYKFYVMDLIENTPQQFAQDSLDALRHTAQTTEPAFHWEVHEQRLPEGNIIPDAAIMIRYNDEYISTIRGGNHISLPSIIISSNILDKVESESQLHEEAVKLQLASLDSDTLHAPTRQEIKSDQQRTLIMNLLS